MDKALEVMYQSKAGREEVTRLTEVVEKSHLATLEKEM
jgi:hypothetical protein